MSKITFRADEDLVERIEAHDASKSEVMREALRAYLGADDSPDPSSDDRQPPRRWDPGVAGRGHPPVDRLSRLTARVDRLAARLDRVAGGSSELDLHLTLDGVSDTTAAVGRATDASVGSNEETTADSRQPTAESSGTRSNRDTRASDTHDTQGDASDTTACAQCGETVETDHVYCPNCGEKTANRLFCDCGDEVRSDWSFCPGCGRRTPAADVLSTPDSPDR